MNIAYFPATAPLPPLPPPTVVLPSHTTGPVPGVVKYYAVEGTPFDGVHTNWVTIAPLLRTIPTASWAGYSTYEAAHGSLVNAALAQQLVAAAMQQFAAAAPAPPDPAPVGPVPGTPAADPDPAGAAFGMHDLEQALAEAPSTSPPPSPTLSSVSSSASTDPVAVSDVSEGSFIDLGDEDPITAARGSRPRGGWQFIAIARGARTGVFPKSHMYLFDVGSGLERTTVSRGFRTEAECRAWIRWYDERYPIIVFAPIDPFESQ
ncbi:hypothetical protein FA95DRAFT_1575242 [Auriscalpium vulgare]|uniref:Uncharacterized protein n=1 Tax=Auriscalpium vulgare TaxID=40419 RepID=A0ACB8RGJ0_9AGAM|nr:hypothetical protein FA95DRAFT_1575242 [Auriscalpium vulgare]